MNELIDAQLDRLVDGEMPLGEQRVLLARLDGDADGWRRLALAFLESQALRQTCPGLLTDSPQWKSAPSVPIKTHSQPPANWLHIAITVAAASITFVLGMWVPEAAGLRPRGASAPDGAERVALDSPQFIAPTSPTVDRLRVVFPEAGGQWSEPVDLPVIDGSDSRAQFWLSDESVLPPSLRNALRESGRQVSENRHWMQVDLEDGRQGYVPVSELIVSANDPSQYP